VTLVIATLIDNRQLPLKILRVLPHLTFILHKAQIVNVVTIILRNSNSINFGSVVVDDIRLG
jgi:hypothetical protein